MIPSLFYFFKIKLWLEGILKNIIYYRLKSIAIVE